MTNADSDESLLSELNESLSVKDDEGNVVLQVALLATVYFEDAYKREVREAVTECSHEYFRRCGRHLRWAYQPDKRQMEAFGKGKGSDVKAWLPTLPEDRSFSVIFHGADHERGASPYSFEAYGAQRQPYTEYGFLRLSLPLGFGDSLRDTLLSVCRTLKPASGYAGIGIIESPDNAISSEYEPIVYEWAQRFPGLEADYPVSHSLWLPEGRHGECEGIKGVNWLTALHDRFLRELGGVDKVASDLAVLDPGFSVHEYGGGAIIQAGQHPMLGDVERDIWPTQYVKLAKYLLPVRVTTHNAFQHDGPGERFDNERSEAWLRRFDDR
ncbi:MAG TPA: type VI immunity family protein [Candidatus Nanopelagicales bacterium]|nr:type VI immunity family protein [Candidatus Nanopelagicales bacterium]